MVHTLVHDRVFLQIMRNYVELNHDPEFNLQLVTWDLSWPLLKLLEHDQISIEGITDSGWDDLQGFYEWLIQQGMEPIF